MKTTIRPLAPADMDAYVALVGARPGIDRAAAERRAGLVEHLAFRNPVADGRPTWFVADAGGALMAHLGRLPTRFQIGEQQHLASYVVDLFVHPELRATGRGFFTSMGLYQRCEKASESFCVFVWTNEINIQLQTARKYHQQWATRYVKYLALDGKIDTITAGKPGAGALRRLGKPAARAVLGLADQALLRARAPARDRLAIERVGRFDERFDELAARIGRRAGIAPVKDAAYLRWKYVDRPLRSQVTLAATDAGDRLCGFTVLMLERDAGQSGAVAGVVLELVCDPGDTATMRALLRAACEQFRADGATTVTCVASDPRVARQLRQLAFVAREPALPLFVGKAAAHPCADRLHDASAWHFSCGDSEGQY